MRNYLLEIAEVIGRSLPSWTSSIFIRRNEIVIHIKSGKLLQFLNFLKKNLLISATSLMDILAVDFPTRKQRFEVIYYLLSTRFNLRFIIKTQIAVDENLNSVTSIFKAAGWLEREVWDMYGIFFKGHPDLRRILTDYGFDGYPLRKDFPLSGFMEIRYDDEVKRVVSEPLELSQEFRCFNFKSPWENKI